jgi:hypothetical protein
VPADRRVPSGPSLPDTDQKNLDALTRMTGRSVGDRMS